jgi:N-acyl-L-homoserine lactone synthetase
LADASSIPRQFPQPRPDDGSIVYRRAVEREELEAIYRLRYQCYRAEEFIPARADGRFSDKYDDDPNAFVFGVEHESALVASIRLHIISAEMPFGAALDVYPDIIGPAIDRGETFVDPSRFVVDRSMRRAMGQMPFATVRLAAMAAEHFETDHVLATVRLEHIPFYRRFCDMELVTEPRSYPGLIRPLALMAGRSCEIRESVYPRQSHFASTHRDRIRLFGLSRMIGLGMADPPAFNDNAVSASRKRPLAPKES